MGCLGGGAGRGAATVRRGEAGGRDWVGRARCNGRRRVALILTFSSFFFFFFLIIIITLIFLSFLIIVRLQ